jgi:pimeloyl-ACP methyl ester carboxylesterase
MWATGRSLSEISTGSRDSVYGESEPDVSAIARLYWESHLAFFDVKGVEIPVGVTVFPDELYPAPHSWAEKAYPKLIHFNEVDEGGHFAAWEQPQLFSEELRAGFRKLR